MTSESTVPGTGTGTGPGDRGHENSAGPTVPDPAPGAEPPRWRFPRPRLRDALPIVLLMAVVMFSGVLLMRHNMTFSRTDELEHFDYVTGLVDRHMIPRKGDLYTQQAIRAQACFRYQIASAPLPACNAPTLDPHDFGNSGVTSAGGYPPVYYTATALVAVPLRALFGFRSLYVPARLASLLWLALGSVATYLLVRSLRAGRWTACAVALVATFGPYMMSQGTTVNPDSLSLLAGSGTALAWLHWRGDPRWRAVLGLGLTLAVVALVKPNFMAVPVAVVTAELALALESGRRGLLRWRTWSLNAPFGRVLMSGALGAGLGALWMLAFMVLDRPGLTVNPATEKMGARPWSTDLALRWTPGSYSPLGGGPFFVHVLDHGILIWFMSLVNLLVVAGAVGAALLSRRRRVTAWQVGSAGAAAVEPGRAVGYLAAAALLWAAPMMYAIMAAGHRFIPYPNRYSLFIVPLGLAALAGFAGRVRLRWFLPLAGVAVLSYWWYLGVP